MDPMTDDAIAYYSGLLGRLGLLSEALCWTVLEPVTEPLTVEAVAARLGGDPAGIRELPWDAAYQLDGNDGGGPVVHLAQAGQAVMMLEVNGFLGAGEAAQALSEGARVHSAFWNVNALSALTCAALGRLLVTFEALFPDRRQGLDIGALDEELDPLYAALSAPRSDFRPVIMAIIERRTGMRLGEDWLAAGRPAIVLPDPLAPGGRTVAPGALFDPELESAVRLASGPARAALVGDLVQALADAGQLGGEPEIRAARAALASGVPHGDAAYAPLPRLAARLTAEFDQAPRTGPVRDDPAWRRARAAEAIRLALAPPGQPPPPWPLLNSLQLARLILGDTWLTLRSQLRSQLRRSAAR
jgi:hypothetical protein